MDITLTNGTYRGLGYGVVLTASESYDIIRSCSLQTPFE